MGHCHLGMKAPNGVNADSDLVHTSLGTPGHIIDIAEANTLFHVEESVAFGDAGYQGVENDLMPTQTSLGMSPRARAFAKH